MKHRLTLPFAWLLAGILLADAATPSGPRVGKLPAAKVLFLGNSITLHGPLPSIGWSGNWGMAASAEEKDYVHLLTAQIAKASGAKPKTMVKNIADFERQHATFDIANGLQAELDFKADIVILAIGENVPGLATEEAKANYAAAYAKLLAELKQRGIPAIFVRSCFPPNPVKDDIMKQASAAAGATFVDIAALGRDASNGPRAERKVEHDGVAGHPGDKGMQGIADALWLAIQKRAAVAQSDGSKGAAQIVDISLSDATIRAAVAKSLPLLEKAAKGSMEKRKQCFTCHNQGLPVMALTTARARGFTVDAENLRQQIQFTADFLAKNRTNYLAGRGQGGQVDTAGFALWTLANGGWKPDTNTAAVAEFLLLFQKDLENYQPQSRRPPTEQSLFTSSHVALRGLKTFGTPEQRGRIDRRFAQVRQWLVKTPAQDTEDRVSRLRALQVAGASPEEIRRAAQELIQAQRADGGWSQLANLESDAYATGTALVALHQAGGLSTTDPAYRKGLKYLLSIQRDDGSWHVKTRSVPIQTYYESGYPHGEDQFISISAASWATTALALSLKVSK